MLSDQDGSDCGASFVIADKGEDFVDVEIDKEPLFFVVIRKVIAFFSPELLYYSLILLLFYFCEEQSLSNVFLTVLHEEKSSMRVRLKVDMGKAVKHNERNSLFINYVRPGIHREVNLTISISRCKNRSSIGFFEIFSKGHSILPTNFSCNIGLP